MGTYTQLTRNADGEYIIDYTDKDIYDMMKQKNDVVRTPRRVPYFTP